MNALPFPVWTRSGDDNRRERTECPNCGGTDEQTDDNGSRICWKCGARWSA